jgi:hypothetical protein
MRSQNSSAVSDEDLAYLFSTFSPSKVPCFPARSPTSHVSGIAAAHGVLIPRPYLNISHENRVQEGHGSGLLRIEMRVDIRAILVRRNWAGMEVVAL